MISRIFKYSNIKFKINRGTIVLHDKINHNLQLTETTINAEDAVVEEVNED